MTGATASLAKSITVLRSASCSSSSLKLITQRCYLAASAPALGCEHDARWIIPSQLAGTDWRVHGTNRKERAVMATRTCPDCATEVGAADLICFTCGANLPRIASA